MTQTITDRQAALLSGVIEEYIRTARPVSSEQVRTYLDLAVSPATVRADLHELEELGFLVSPHTSAGRIPTDQGYRHYVDHLRADRLSRPEQADLTEQLHELRQRHEHLSRSTAKLLSLLAQSVVITNIPEARGMYMSGLSRFLEEPEGTSTEALREMSHVVEALDEYVAQFEKQSQSHDPQVFIGQEIPFLKAQHTSLLVRAIHPENDQRMTVVIVGPKRMAYQRNLSLLNAVADIIEDNT